MEYRKFEKLGISASALGFGCMRFPQTKDGKIDEAATMPLFEKAIENGLTYIDTAVPYHGGESELFVGKVLKRFGREKLLLATKLPPWQVNSREDAVKIFEQSLKKLDTDYVDFYLLHALNKDSWKKLQDLNIPQLCEQWRQEGKIRYLGFSFHDEYEVFEDIIKSRSWDFCQLQLNYMDTDEQAGLKGLKLAEQQGVPVVVMEPVKGGSLAALPEKPTKMLRELNQNTSTASWALRWIASQPNVKVVLSGMSTMEQVEDNLKTFGNFQPLTAHEMQVVEQVAEIIRASVKNGCTRCQYCMPCPKGVDIPQIFRIWNTYGMYENKAAAVRSLKDMGKEKRGWNCIECGKCEKLCPQSLPIRQDLKRAEETFAALETN